MDLLYSLLFNLASFVVIISVIVFIHESGHFYVARWCGVKIEAFSIGFGPELTGWNDKYGTRWKICAFPLGGYVKMFGDTGAASTPDGDKIRDFTEEERKIAFHTQPLSSKAAIVAAGPIANFILAILILSFFFSFYGRPETAPEVGTVMKGSAAEAAGLQPGDVIVSLDGTRISRFEEIRGIASLNPDSPLELTYTRGGQEITATITPKLSETTDIFGNKVKIGLIGIASSSVIYNKLSVPSAIAASFSETWNISVKTLEALGQIATGRRSTEDLSGVLRIAKFSGQSMEMGLNTVFWFMAVLSINLGLINLFPIPLLDGGHLMYYALEAVRGKPLAERIQEYGFRVGLAFLILLMVFATFNDLKHFGVF